MDSIKVVGWTDWDSAYPNIDFKKFDQQVIIASLLEAIREGGYVFSGQTHQNDMHGVPVFSNGTCLRCSMRTWGLIMASCKGSNQYMDFYINVDGEEALPDTDPEVAPDEKEFDNGALPVAIGPDQNMIMESLDMGIDLMTTDKALLELYPFFKRLHQ